MVFYPARGTDGYLEVGIVSIYHTNIIYNMKKTLAIISLAMTLGLSASAQEVGTAGVPFITLSNGINMPQFGIGTFQIPDNATCKEAVLTALRQGYRHIDTAHAYMDEQGVGQAVNQFMQESGVKREEIWVTSKTWPSEYTDPNVIDKMLARLGLDYVDLVYPHQPVGEVKAGWKILEKAVKEGKVRCLGLSNFENAGAEDLYRWCVDSTEIKPVILQMECHPYAQRLQVKEQLKKDNMVVECWYPLGGSSSRGALMKDPTIVAIAQKKGMTPAQVILRWHIQEGHSIIPKSTNPAHIQENLNTMKFTLTEEEMQQMRALNKEKRFYQFNIEATREFVNFKLPETPEENQDWQNRMTNELNTRN